MQIKILVELHCDLYGREEVNKAILSLPKCFPDIGVAIFILPINPVAPSGTILNHNNLFLRLNIKKIDNG